MITCEDPEVGTLSWIVWVGPVLSLKVESFLKSRKRRQMR